MSLARVHHSDFKWMSCLIAQDQPDNEPTGLLTRTQCCATATAGQQEEGYGRQEQCCGQHQAVAMPPWQLLLVQLKHAL